MAKIIYVFHKITFQTIDRSNNDEAIRSRSHHLPIRHKGTSTSRMRSVKLYSSTTEHGAVDPYIGLPDERRQRSLDELSMSLTTLEMSMPTIAARLTDQSFFYSLQGAAPAAENAGLPVAVIAAEEEAYNSATMMGHSSVVAAAIVSAIAGVVALA